MGWGEGVVIERIEQGFSLKGHLTLKRLLKAVEIVHVLFSIELARETLRTCSLFDGCYCAPLYRSLYGALMGLVSLASFLMTLPSSVLSSLLLVLSRHSRLLETLQLQMIDPSQRPPPLVTRVRLSDLPLTFYLCHLLISAASSLSGRYTLLPCWHGSSCCMLGGFLEGASWKGTAHHLCSLQPRIRGRHV